MGYTWDTVKDGHLEECSSFVGISHICVGVSQSFMSHCGAREILKAQCIGCNIGNNKDEACIVCPMLIVGLRSLTVTLALASGIRHTALSHSVFHYDGIG